MFKLWYPFLDIFLHGTNLPEIQILYRSAKIIIYFSNITRKQYVVISSYNFTTSMVAVNYHLYISHMFPRICVFQWCAIVNTHARSGIVRTEVMFARGELVWTPQVRKNKGMCFFVSREKNKGKQCFRFLYNRCVFKIFTFKVTNLFEGNTCYVLRWFPNNWIIFINF